ncbi:hypothetical protein CTI12_AA021530 [Artemisia annua]|uniref:GRF-type domain-containing protein n=1 Tax=Artemisia annua TaxID=35608 RepID=A0A2U1QJK6_ARTAN|nr:hypothetical protein CTI12_AA021530 [Artemisia annua]
MDVMSCFCGNHAIVRTSWTDTNPGRRFWSCPQIGTNCGFFLWLDPPMCVRSRSIDPWIAKIKKCTSTVFELNGDCKP